MPTGLVDFGMAGKEKAIGAEGHTENGRGEWHEVSEMWDREFRGGGILYEMRQPYRKNATADNAATSQESSLACAGSGIWNGPAI
ncbi:MAG TPA: hypothetical protein VMX56_00535, partial [Anaerolineales bacterium]|nr:hypothetical protein [Anaerolineales bacterium]